MFTLISGFVLSQNDITKDKIKARVQVQAPKLVFDTTADTPDVTDYTLYQIGSILYWHGNPVASGGGGYISLTGDVTGSGTTTITVTVLDDGHNHIISNVDFLQDSLDKIDDSIRALRDDMIIRWEKELTIDDENDWALPFDLKATSIIIYNGTPLRPAQWTGSGSSTLTLGILTRRYDHLVLIN